MAGSSFSAKITGKNYICSEELRVEKDARALIGYCFGESFRCLEKVLEKLE